MNNKNVKINLVNPLNPNQIIKEEIIEVKENIEQPIEQEELEPTIDIQPTEKKQNKKSSLWIIVIIFIILLGLGAGYFIFIKDKPNNTNMPTQNIGITLNDISNNFNQNIINYNTIENSNITSSVLNNRINIKVIINDETINYDFILNDQVLTTSLSNEDVIGYEVTLYLSCAVANYYNIDFDSSYTYLKNNQNDLNNINNITITNQDQTKKISINLNEKLIIK